MSTYIHWEPHKPDPRSIVTDCPQGFHDTLRRVFTRRNLVFDERDLPTLITMSMVDPEFHQLVSAVESNGCIRVWSES